MSAAAPYCFCTGAVLHLQGGLPGLRGYCCAVPASRATSAAARVALSARNTHHVQRLKENQRVTPPAPRFHTLRSVFWKQRHMRFYPGRCRPESLHGQGSTHALPGLVPAAAGPPLTGGGTAVCRLNRRPPGFIDACPLVDPFFAGWCFAIPTFVTRIPYSFLESTIWTMMVSAWRQLH